MITVSPPPYPPRQAGEAVSLAACSEALPADKVVERSAPSRDTGVRRQTQRFWTCRIPDREHRPQIPVLRDAEQLAGAPLIAVWIDRSDAGADAVRPGGQHQVLHEPSLIHAAPGIVSTHDERDRQLRAGEVPGKLTAFRERLQRLPVPHDHEVPRLRVFGRPRPSARVEDVAQNVIGDLLV